MTSLDVMAFGSTGHQSTRVIFGAAALGGMSQARADATLDLIAAAGVNHIDTAAGYGDSELRLAPFLAEHRAEVFLATKTGERTASRARRELERSLERMGVGSVDLIQLHNLVEDDEWATAHAPGGVLEALIAARDEGLVRFIGVTGHGLRIPRMLLRSLEAFPYDSVLAPYSYVLLRDRHYRRDVTELLDVCAQRGVAVQTIKSIARRRWQPDTTERRFAWYEPLPAGPALDRAVQFVLANPQVFLNTTADATRLPAVLTAAQFAGAAPDVDDLEGDLREQHMTPLFDGGALERI